MAVHSWHAGVMVTFKGWGEEVRASVCLGLNFELKEETPNLWLCLLLRQFVGRYLTSGTGPGATLLLGQMWQIATQI